MSMTENRDFTPVPDAVLADRAKTAWFQSEREMATELLIARRLIDADRRIKGLPYPTSNPYPYEAQDSAARDHNAACRDWAKLHGHEGSWGIDPE